MQWLIYARDLLATKRASRERATRTRAPVTVARGVYSFKNNQHSSSRPRLHHDIRAKN